MAVVVVVGVGADTVLTLPSVFPTWCYARRPPERSTTHPSAAAPVPTSEQRLSPSLAPDVSAADPHASLRSHVPRLSPRDPARHPARLNHEGGTRQLRVL